MTTTNSQDEPFKFSADNQRLVKRHIAKYPKGRQQSAVLALLDLAQRQCGGWLPQSTIDTVAELLKLPKIRVLEVATFYSMFNLEPVGQHVVQICTTTPCWLSGSSEIIDACEKHLKVRLGSTTEDGVFTLREVECMGCCVNAPMMQIGDNYYEDLTPVNVVSILERFARGEAPNSGSQSGRQRSAPSGTRTTLLHFAKGDDRI